MLNLKKEKSMKNVITWFEIPAIDYDRAKKFYSEVLNVTITDSDMPNCRYGVFPLDQENNGTSGAIMKMEGCKPSADGATVYFDGGNDLSVPLARVEAAGGSILVPKTDIGENGFFAQFIDTEGNRVALHSWN
jgi:predicted enzyme related to lactoylglutathione lyase